MNKNWLFKLRAKNRYLARKDGLTGEKDKIILFCMIGKNFTKVLGKDNLLGFSKN